jgi:DNA invertase Pin-like site-specific DNA recombinase
MGQVFVYRRMPLAGKFEGHAAAVEAALAGLPKGLAVHRYQDSAATLSEPLPCRTQGARLCGSVEAGDTVIFSARDCANASDLVSILETWTVAGIRCVVLDVGLDTAEAGSDKTLRTLAAVVQAVRDVRGERVARGLRERRALGRPTNGRVVYGYRHAGPKGNRRYVKDPKQRKIGKQILQWRLAGYTWESIWIALAQRGARNAQGKEISLGTIRRWCIGEARLQALEARRAREPQEQVEVKGTSVAGAAGE